jgi:propionyl-CoA carboxylase beta chain
VTATAEIPAPDEPDVHTTAGKLAELRRRNEAALTAGSEAALEKRRKLGKRTARERIESFLDEGSFVETDALTRHRARDFGLEKNRPMGDGVITGYGTVDGRPVCVFSQDATVFGGALGEVYGEKIVKVMDLALKTGCPVVGLNEGSGARIQEGIMGLALYGDIFYRNVMASGVVPQISLILGNCAGGHVYSPALTDFNLMVDQGSAMMITGPDVIKTVTGEDITIEDLGGARAHNSKSGVAHFMSEDEDAALELAKILLSFLPSNNLEEPPAVDDDVDALAEEPLLQLDTIIPDSNNAPYDMKSIITSVLDDNDFLEVQSLWATSIVAGFGRIEGRSVGVVGQQPDAVRRHARHRRLGEGGPLRAHLRRLQHPGADLLRRPRLPAGVGQEHAGIIRHGAKLLYAYSEATVPLVTVITRKAYGGSYVAMGSKHLGADVNLAWPTAQVAVVGALGAVNIVRRKEIAAADDPEAARAAFMTEYEDTFATPYIAAERGFVDAVIEPSQTRREVAKALRQLRGKRETLPPKKHGNIPL